MTDFERIADWEREVRAWHDEEREPARELLFHGARLAEAQEPEPYLVIDPALGELEDEFDGLELVAA